MRAALSIAREATRYGRVPLMRPLVRLADLLHKPSKTPIGAEAIANKGSNGQLRWLQRETINDPNSRSAVWILQHASRDAAAHRRRENFRYLLERTTDFRRADAPVPPGLPEGVVPYMFPIVGQSGDRFSTPETACRPRAIVSEN